jgi:hypothetical protein
LRFAANPAASPLFRFTKLESAEADAATLRMLSDANWAGSGVRSYQALAAIYRDAPSVPLGRLSIQLHRWRSNGGTSVC